MQNGLLIGCVTTYCTDMQNYPNISKMILASASPRRRELLSSLGCEFTVEKPEIDEIPRAGEKPKAYAERLSREKAEAIQIDKDTVLISADTIVVQGSTILEKPTGEAHAFEMLAGLSGRKHEVITAVTVRTDENVKTFSVSTKVAFRTLSKQEIISYIATGCPMDKAGGYAIQGGAAHMVRSISGSYTNVVGLPLCELHEALVSL